MSRPPLSGVPRRRRLMRAAGVVLSLCVVITGCTVSDEDRSAQGVGSPITPEGLKQDLGAFRDSNGLYFSPQAVAGTGSAYSTALLAAGFSRDVVKPAVSPTLLRALCDGDDKPVVEGVWRFWSVATIVGASPAARSVWKCVDRRFPSPMGDPTVDIPEEWAWATATLASGEPLGPEAGRLRMTLDRHQPATLPPYVMWRWVQLARLVHHDIPKLSPGRVTSLESTANLLDLWGASELCGAARDCGGLDSLSDEQLLDAQARLGDDLSLTSVGSILGRRGSPRAATLVPGLRNRAVRATGLLRSASPQGEINSTFKVLQIAPDLFERSQRSATAIRMHLDRVPRSDRVLRARALAVFKAYGGDLAPYANEIADYQRLLEKVAGTPADVRNAINLAEAVRLVGVPSTPSLRITLFPVRDQRDWDIAVLILTNADLLADRKAVKDHFTSIAAELSDVVNKPTDPLSRYYHAINALPQLLGSSDESADAKMAAGLPPLKGCVVNGRRLEWLFVANTSGDRPCSLEATWLVYQSSFYPRGA